LIKDNFLFSQTLDQEQWKPTDVPELFQKIVDKYVHNGELRFYGVIDDSADSSSRTTPEPLSIRNGPVAEFLVVDGEKYIVVGTCLLLLRMMAQYCTVLAHFPQCAHELSMQMVALLKTFNSRTCQLILGAGALQLVGLKTISVKTLALAARCLQLIIHFIPVVKQQFLSTLPQTLQSQGRHFDTTLKDYNDHVEEIYSKLVTVVDQHLTNGLSQVIYQFVIHLNVFSGT
jgi:vacuolar protein sorting-associated protein 54